MSQPLGLLTLLLYPKVRDSTSEISYARLTVGNKSEYFFTSNWLVVLWSISCLEASYLRPSNTDTELIFLPNWV